MKKNIFLKILLFVSVLSSSFIYADGSKDLYPNGATGLRAYLRSSLTATENWPFPNQGVHYVYAEVGERITLASSAQDAGATSRIRLIAPDGAIVVNNNTVAGLISNRSEEKAGPQLFGGIVSGRYTPIYYKVVKAGIYRVEFVARGTTNPDYTVLANSNWVQDNSVGIMAWDVSVINAGNSAFIPGRVYTNILNLSNGLSNVSTDGFYGLIYALTKDGYTYRVNNNGNNGIYFTFFVNNNGFIDSMQNPIYKSLNGSSPGFLAGKVHNPNTADTAKNITHKMFYTLPSNDLPTSSVGAVPSLLSVPSTWLKNPVVTPHVTQVSIVGVEGVVGQVSKKGGYIKFDADVQGTYSITIQATPANPAFVPRVLNGPSSAGTNQIFWDGKDGSGAASPVGTYPVKITTRLQGAEVHFPYIDMEYNKRGTIVQLLDHVQLNTLPNPVVFPVSDIVYWNDTGITGTTTGSVPTPINNSAGISSVTNGHKWGSSSNGGSSGLFGDEKAIDTWTFIKAEEATVITSVMVKSADLMVNSITPNQTSVLVGDQVSYTIKVKNGGPSDVVGAPFLFKVPAGLSPQNIQFVAGCGTESVAMTYNAGTSTYSSKLNLISGCEITYIITVTVSNVAVAGNQQVEAAILRTNDVTDPDATNPNITIPPTDPYYECANNGLGGSCNNIKKNNIVVVTLACFNPQNTLNLGSPAEHGITLLQRAGSDNGNWPMIRTSAFTVLESNSKGFVITRMTTAQISGITAPQEGMMTYDTNMHCLKIYADGIWSCFNKPGCP